MIAGRDLDYLVVEHVFGRDPETIDPWSLPDYSGNGGGMLSVIDRMKALGWYWEGVQGFSPEQTCSAGFGTPGWTPCDWVVAGDSLPHATALAALAAVGHPVPGVDYGGWLAAGREKRA